MTMKDVVNHLRDDLIAATGTYLGPARVLRGDPATTQRSDTVAVIRVIPLPSEDVGEAIGATGWYDLFRIHIRAVYPATWAETDKQLDLAEEIKQVIRDNWSFNAGGEQATLKKRRWGYGFDASGEQTLNTVDIIVEYEVPQPGATA